MTERRGFLAGSLFAGLSAAAAPARAAEDAGPSTWQRIRQTQTFRLGGAVSDAWCFKDLTGSSKPGAVTVDNVTWRGVGVVIASKLAAALGAKLQIVDVTWANAIAGLQANQFDTIFGFDATPERAAAVQFIPQPFYWMGVALLAKPEIDVSTWDALSKAKLRIAVPAGTSMEYELKKRSPEAQLQSYPGYNEAIAAFQSGRADAIAGSSTTATLLTGRLPGTVARMPQQRALFPISGGVRQEIDQRFVAFLSTAIGYYADNGVIQDALLDMYAFRGVDIAKVEAVVNR